MCGQPWRPLTLHQVSGSSSRRHPSQSLEPNFLFTAPARTTGPSRFCRRDTVACLWHARFPAVAWPLHHPWWKCAEDAAAPPSLSLPGAVEAHAFELPDVLAFTSGPAASTQAAGPLSRTALALHSSWGRTRTVSFSSVETLGRALVCTLPLSARF